MATRIQKLLFVDTNVWLDFYRARNDAYLTLIDKVERIADRIIVTHQLETEYKTNRQTAILEGLSVLKTPNPVPSVGVLATANDFLMLRKELRKASHRVRNLEERLAKFLTKPGDIDPVYPEPPLPPVICIHVVRRC